MSASRRRGWAVRLAVLVVSAVVSGAVVLGLGSRGDLEAAGERVDAAWGQLRPGLDERYAALAQAAEEARERMGGDPALLTEVAAGLASWGDAGRRSAEAQATLANRLEGYAARLAALVEATPRLRSSDSVADALDEFRRADPAPAREAYNRAVADYEDVRGGFPRRLVAGALGFDARRTLEIPA